jgi:hypothetical protein
MQSYRVGLIIGYFTREEVVHWLDSVIAQTPAENLPTEFFDISFSKERALDSIVFSLKKIPGECDERGGHRTLLGMLYSELASDEGKVPLVIEYMDRLARELGPQEGELSVKIWAAHSTYDKHADLYNDMPAAILALFDFLRECEPDAEHLIQTIETIQQIQGGPHP